jgi:hypothetical protein
MAVMTASEFDTLRSDLRALRMDMDARFAHMETRFSKLEAKLDEKPGVATIYQAALSMFAGMFAVLIGTIIILKTTGIIP